MIDFLKEHEISNQTLEKLKQMQSPAFLSDLNCNEEECVKIIKYFKELGINNIEELLIYESEIFFKTYNNVKTAFSKHNIDELVKLINEDYSNIEKLYYYL